MSLENVSYRPVSVEEEVRNAYIKGEKRDSVVDAKRYLGEHHVPEPVVTYTQKNIPDVCTIVLANHYCPPWMERGNLFSIDRSTTTPTSTVTTALITLAVAKLTDRKISWIVEDIDPNNFGEIEIWKYRKKVPIPSKTLRTLRLTQKAAINVYDQIPRTDDKSFLIKLRNAAKAGNNLGAYPEGNPAFEMRDYVRNPKTGIGFNVTFDMLAKARIPYQILTVGIYKTDGRYQLRVNPVLSPGNEFDSESLLRQSMYTLASSLPRENRGPWESDMSA